MIKEARMILPLNDNHGASLEKLHEHLRGIFADTFGGVTIARVHGVWRNPDTGQVIHEENFEYRVATRFDNYSRDLLRDIAASAARDGRQECIYLALPNGEIEYIKPATVEAQQAAVTRQFKPHLTLVPAE